MGSLSKDQSVWEAHNGLITIEVGKRRNGKPHRVLMVALVVCMSEADAKRVPKLHPALKFVKRKLRPVHRAGKEGP